MYGNFSKDEMDSLYRVIFSGEHALPRTVLSVLEPMTKVQSYLNTYVGTIESRC